MFKNSTFIVMMVAPPVVWIHWNFAVRSSLVRPLVCVVWVQSYTWMDLAMQHHLAPSHTPDYTVATSVVCPVGRTPRGYSATTDLVRTGRPTMSSVSSRFHNLHSQNSSPSVPHLLSHAPFAPVNPDLGSHPGCNPLTPADPDCRIGRCSVAVGMSVCPTT